MLLDLQSTLRRRIAAGAAELFGVSLGEAVVEIPRDLKNGDLATPVAFDLAKRIKAETGEKKNPRDLATALAEWLRVGENAIDGISRIDIAGAGYINFFLDRAGTLAALSGHTMVPVARSEEKVLVEHTSVNPNKAAHIGHLRNSVLGDTIVRMLRATGESVEIQNYIDNTGVQVTDVVVGFLHVEPHTLEEIKAIPDPFDYYCWDLYSRVGVWYRDGNPEGRENPERIKIRNEVQHEIELGEGSIAEMAEYVAMRNLEALLGTMLRFGIVYDVLPRESEVLQSNFWADAFEMLKSAGLVFYAEDGKHAGCWVMKSDEESEKAEGEDEDEFAADKILVKSNGLVTYTGKDIAYHLWKLNRIERDFDYRKFFTYENGHVAWITTPMGTGEPGHPRFGHGVRYINVIDVGQSYVQDFVKRAVVQLSPDPRAAESTHLNYEKVGLTVAACDELGLPLSEDERKKTFVGMSGRKGRGVKVGDLINLLEEKALEEVRQRLSERNYEPDEQLDIAHKIAVGAVRYFLLKYTRNSVIAFDFKEALSFQGETGPYLQYAIARINSMFVKWEAAGFATERPLANVPEKRINELFSRADGETFWPLVYLVAQYPEVLERSADALEPATLAKYAFTLAQQFASFYNSDENQVMKEADEARRALLIEICSVVRATLTAALSALGIDAPRRM